MKTFRIILLTILNILSIPVGAILSAGIVWYILPLIQTTVLGMGILQVISASAIFWTVISCAIIFITAIVLQKIFNKDSKAKFKNLFIHLNSWIIALVAIGLSIATFILVDPLVADTIVITLPRKISIGVMLLGLILFHIFSDKLLKIINRRIQAYETAKEVNAIGRGSVIITNILKLFELFFPEMLVLSVICLCVSWNISSYFIIILASCIIPLIGNIECDFNIRSEIKRNEEKEKDLLAEKISNNLKGN